MDPEELLCPLCCGEKFPCRASLRAHIVRAAHSITCPACKSNLSSIDDLVVHLESEECHNLTSGKIEFVETLESEDNECSIDSPETEMLSQNNQVYGKLVKFESMQSCDKEEFITSDSQTMNVIENGDSRILIVDSDSGRILSHPSIITTQNEDGTISFTQVAEETADCDEPAAETEEAAAEEGGEGEGEGGELYSCNTCRVTFTSVVEHIHTYHSEQDVVVEVAEAETMESSSDLQGNGEEASPEGFHPSIDQHVVLQKDNEGRLDVSEENNGDGLPLTYTRRLVRINKFWENSQVTADEAIFEETVEQLNDDKTNTKIFTCRKCRIKDTLEVIQNHICPPKGVYYCTHCTANYSNPKSLCAHMKAHKSRKPEDAFKKASQNRETFHTFKCEVCETIFTSNKSLRLHKRMHDPVKSRPMEGPVTYENLTGCESEDTYHCKLCDKWIHVGYRDIHDAYHCSTTQYHCDICNRKFLTKDYLTMHMNVHNIEKISVNKKEKGVLPYSCMYCERKFARPHEKVKHERIHTGEKPHSCEICGKSFRVSYCLTLHMRTHTGERPYECPHCQKRFKAHSVYNHHLLTHSDVRAYKCTYCPKAFKTSVQLAGHKNSHTKPFSCTHCNRPFASLYAVRVHTETHRRQNNLKYSCGLCGATYARAFALKDHVSSTHSDAQVEVMVLNQEAD